MLGALIVWWPASFWLQWTMADGTVHTGSPAKFSTKPTEEWKKIRKMYAIKQIKICAEYRDMLPRPRLDLSGTHGLRPIGLSPGSWQTSLGLGSMSRYSAQILICIVMIIIQCLIIGDANIVSGGEATRQTRGNVIVIVHLCIYIYIYIYIYKFQLKPKTLQLLLTGRQLSRYNTVQYNTIIPTLWRWRGLNNCEAVMNKTQFACRCAM